MKYIKYCHSCKQTKATEDFYKTKSANDGLDSRCKDCQKERNLFLNPKSNPARMYVNGKYVSRTHPLYKAGRYKTFEGAAFASLAGYETTKEGYVYIITNPAWGGWLKIGMAIDAEDRCNSYQTSSPFRDFKLVSKEYFNNRMKAERAMHSVLKVVSLDNNGEWFKVSERAATTALKQMVNKNGKQEEFRF